ncbi:hypothetical protein FRC07_004829 [Ceratobasidium sp. 392]|nr:hypothetical protein FRC07_004829 [Ceratobasidium sp. 392]
MESSAQDDPNPDVLAGQTRPEVIGAHVANEGETISNSTTDCAASETVTSTAPVPEGDMNKLQHLDDLCGIHRIRFLCMGDLEDLNIAIERHTEAIPLTANGDLDKPMRLKRLENIHYTRFQSLVGDLADLNTAIGRRTEALLLLTSTSLDRPKYLNNLNVSLWTQFEKLGNIADIGAAIEYQTEAVLLTPDERAEKAARLRCLGNSFYSRFERSNNIVDLDKVVKH